MRYVFSGRQVGDYDEAGSRCWLLTNGIGGCSSLTAAGGSVSKYNAILTAAMTPPGDKYVLCSNIHEIITIDGRQYSLAAFDAGSVGGRGCVFLKRVEIDDYPTYYYETAGCLMTKEIVMIRDANAVAVRYTVETDAAPAELELVPLLNYRWNHGTSRREDLRFRVRQQWQGIVNVDYEGETKYSPRIYIAHTDGEFAPSEKPEYFEGMFYRDDAAKCCAAYEDHFIPGRVRLSVPANSVRTVQLVVFTEQGSAVDVLKHCRKRKLPDFFARESDRREKLRESCVIPGKAAADLAVSASDFLSYREDGRTSIIAGFPWFGFRGGQAAQAAAGICVAAGRYEDARAVIGTLTGFIRDGMLADVIEEGRGYVEYDSADASLWLFDTVYEYYQATGDRDFVIGLRQVLQDIIRCYVRGTFSSDGSRVEMNSLGLIETAPRMTWMDAAIDGRPVAGREGCPVEINGLWYNALRIMERLCAVWDDPNPGRYDILANLTAASFKKYFVTDSGIADAVRFFRTYDGRMEPHRDMAIRCNQLVALGLSFSPCGQDVQNLCLDTVAENMLTPMGIRTLSPDDRYYSGRYGGSAADRDFAAFSGCAWPWVLGFYLRLGYRAGRFDRKDVLDMLEPLMTSGSSGCVGRISNMHEGDAPFAPAGAWASALGEAEVLRTLRLVCGERQRK